MIWKTQLKCFFFKKYFKISTFLKKQITILCIFIFRLAKEWKRSTPIQKIIQFLMLLHLYKKNRQIALLILAVPEMFLYIDDLLQVLYFNKMYFSHIYEKKKYWYICAKFDFISEYVNTTAVISNERNIDATKQKNVIKHDIFDMRKYLFV